MNMLQHTLGKKLNCGPNVILKMVSDHIFTHPKLHTN